MIMGSRNQWRLRRNSSDLIVGVLIAVVLSMVCIPAPSAAAAVLPAGAGPMTSEAIQRLGPNMEGSVQALIWHADGTVGLNEVALATADASLRQVGELFVTAVNRHEIIVHIDPQTGDRASEDLADSWGIHIWFGSSVTSFLRNPSWQWIWWLGQFISGVACTTGLRCNGFNWFLTVAVDVITHNLVPNQPDGFTLHVPWYGTIYVELFRGSWWWGWASLGWYRTQSCMWWCTS